ncbi:unnamed protein product, partial [uncultured virus]
VLDVLACDDGDALELDVFDLDTPELLLLDEALAVFDVALVFKLALGT